MWIDTIFLYLTIQFSPAFPVLFVFSNFYLLALIGNHSHEPGFIGFDLRFGTVYGSVERENKQEKSGGKLFYYFTDLLNLLWVGSRYVVPFPFIV